MRCLFSRSSSCFLFAVFFLCPSLLAQEPLPVTETFQVNAYTTDAQTLPALSVAPDGRFAVVWRGYESSAGGIRIRGQRFEVDGTFTGSGFQINPGTTVFQDAPNVSHADDGAFLVVWQEAPRLLGQRFDSSGAEQGNIFQINTEVQGALFPGNGLSHGRDGVAIATWTFDRDLEGGGQDIWGQRLAPDGSLLGPEFRINSFTLSDQRSPEVSHAPDGSFVVVWQSNGQDGYSWGVHGQRFDRDGLPTGDEFQINTQTLNLQTDPQISHDPSGNFTVIWNDQITVRKILGQRFDASGQTLGSEFEVAPEITNSKFLGVVAHDSHGDFLVVWADIQGSFESDPIAQRFSSLGVPVGDPFPISPPVPGDQSFPRISAGPAGTFVTVWTEDTDDIESFEVLGRVFCSDHDADQTCDGLLEDGFESGDLSRWSNAVPSF